ncbi:hypothetical protein AB0H87_07275, partial [Asanoa sp. NPDC050611]
MRAGRLFAETVLVPTGLLYIVLHTAGLLPALLSVLGWCALTVGIRFITGRHLPGTLLVCAGALCARAPPQVFADDPLVRLRARQLSGWLTPRRCCR